MPAGAARRERRRAAGSVATSGRGRHLVVRQQERVLRDVVLLGRVRRPGQRPGDGASRRRGSCAAALFALRLQRRVRPRERRAPLHASLLELSGSPRSPPLRGWLALAFPLRRVSGILRWKVGCA